MLILLQRFVGFKLSLERLQDVFGLIGLAALLSTTVGATLGVASLCLGGNPWSSFGELWFVWWLGDTMGDVIIAPFLLLLGAAASDRVARLAVGGVGRFIRGADCDWHPRSDRASHFKIGLHVGISGFPVYYLGSITFWTAGDDQHCGADFSISPVGRHPQYRALLRGRIQ